MTFVTGHLLHKDLECRPMDLLQEILTPVGQEVTKAGQPPCLSIEAPEGKSPVFGWMALGLRTRADQSEVWLMLV